MPRNSQGLYTLPLPPVQPGNLVESAWANTTLDDLASAMTGSLPRNGSAPMTGPLQLSADPIVSARQATTKAYVDQFMAFGSGMFVGSFAYAPLSIEPPGWLLCDGRAVSRTVYAELFSAIGVMFGSGDGSTTFNLPSQSGRYLRGGAAGELMGQLLGGTFAAHTHPLSDPGHTHDAYQAIHDHTITTGSHSHGVNDPGHVHTATFYTHNDNGPLLGNANGGAAGTMTTTTNGTGISIQTADSLGGYTDQRQPAVTVNAAGTGQAVGAAGDAENRPASIVCNLFIKAAVDGPGTTVLTGITTSDAAMISVDSSNPVVPELNIHSNVAYGTVKLDASGKVPLNQMPSVTESYLGFFDASGGQNPSEEFPGNTYLSGDFYTISVGGTITVYDPVTLVAAMTVVVTGNQLQYVSGSATNPTGWYYVVITSNAVLKDSNTGGAFIPNGTTTERPAIPAFGQQRANSTILQQEWWNGTAWVPMGTLSIKDFGAIGDGVADDTAAIQVAINYAGSATLHFPSGTYLVTDTITILESALVMVGEGNSLAATTILNGTTNKPSFTIGDGTARFQGGIYNIAFAQKTGVVGVLGNCAVKLLNMEQYTLTNVSVYNNAGSKMFDGFKFDSCVQVVCENLTVSEVLNTGMSVTSDCIDCYFTNCRSDSNGVDGWHITDSQGMYFVSCTAYGNDNSAWVLDTAGPNGNKNQFFVNCVGDTSGSHNWNILQLEQSVFSNCWAATQKSPSVNVNAIGLVLNGVDVKTLRFSTLTSIFNNWHGVYVNGASDITFSACTFGTSTSSHGNGQGTSGGSGIFLDAASDILIDSCVATGNATDGISISAAASGVSVLGGRVAGNVGAQLTNNATDSRIRSLIGYNPRGVSVVTPPVPAQFTGLANQTGVACNVYMRGGTVTDVLVNNVSVFSTTPCTLRLEPSDYVTLVYSVAPTWTWVGE